MTQSPATAEDVIAALTAIFEDLPPALQAAARHVIDNPREVSVHSMRSLATEASVHPNAFVRLARQVGFEGYEDMRERFRDFVVSDEFGGFSRRAKWLQDLNEKGGSSAILAEMTEAVGDNLDRGFRRQDIRQLEVLCDRILDARTVYVLGMGAAYAIAYQFWYVARMAIESIVPIPRHGSEAIDDLAFADSRDLLIALTFQPYRSETMTAVRLAMRRGAMVCGVTDSATSPLALEADMALICPTSTPQFFPSHAAVMALLETLTALLVSRAGESTRARIHAFHKERLDAGIYEEDIRHAGLTGVAQSGEKR